MVIAEQVVVVSALDTVHEQIGAFELYNIHSLIVEWKLEGT